MRITITLKLLICICVLGTSGERITPGMTNTSWPGGYHATLTIPIKEAVKDWTLRFVFDQPIDTLEVWTPVIVSHTATEWYTHSRADGEVLPAGQNLVIEMNARYQGNPLILGSYYFNVENYASTTRATTPTKTTTTTTTTATTTATTTTYTSVTSTPTITVGRTSHNYTEALRLSTMFYDAQRSGPLPAYNPITWRNDSAVNDSDNGHDLTGGWYNGGDHVKFNMPMAFSTWVLEWGIYEFLQAYRSSNQAYRVCNMIKWPLDYLLKSWIPDEQTLYVQVGETSMDHAYWGSPENMKMDRPVYKVTPTCKGSDVAADTVSAFAAGFLVFRYACSDSRYAYKLHDAAQSLYKFAKDNRGMYSQCVSKYDHLYDSSRDEDEMATAAAWMYKITQEKKYLNDAESFYNSSIPWDFSWTDTNIAAALLLYNLTHKEKYRNDIEGFLKSYMPNGDVYYTPCGLVWRDQWGPNRYAANAALIALMAAENGIHPNEYKAWAMTQINYLLGDNKMNMSYEIGYGNNYTLQPHHRGSSCSGSETPCMYLDPNPNPNILFGGLVGGPDIIDNYEDKRSNYVQNEVALDFNAGFQSALAGLVYFSEMNDLPPVPASKC